MGRRKKSDLTSDVSSNSKGTDEKKNKTTVKAKEKSKTVPKSKSVSKTKEKAKPQEEAKSKDKSNDESKNKSNDESKGKTNDKSNDKSNDESKDKSKEIKEEVKPKSKRGRKKKIINDTTICNNTSSANNSNDDNNSNDTNNSNNGEASVENTNLNPSDKVANGGADQNKNLEIPIKKKRGRKPKIRTEEDNKPKIPRKRGRKPKEKFKYDIDPLNSKTYNNEEDDNIIVRLPITQSDIDRSLSLDSLLTYVPNITNPKPFDKNIMRNNLFNMSNNLNFSSLSDNNSLTEVKDNNSNYDNNNAVDNDLTSNISDNLNNNQINDDSISSNNNNNNDEINNIKNLNTISNENLINNTNINSISNQNLINDTNINTASNQNLINNTDNNNLNDIDLNNINLNNNSANNVLQKMNTNLKNNINTILSESDFYYDSDKKNSKKRQIDVLLQNRYQKEKKLELLCQFKNYNKDKKWPSSTKVSCFWCCHEFNHTPWGIPLSYEDDTFKIFGIFCTPNCAASYLFQSFPHTENVWENYALLNLLYYKVYGVNKKITPAPSKICLKKFGGQMDIEEFRYNLANETTYAIKFPPAISIIPIMEEVNLKKIQYQNNYIPVDKSRILQANNQLRLKRSKPLNNKNTLDNCLQITKV